MNFIENIILENNRVRIEPLSHIHFNDLLPIAINHPNLLQYSPSPFGSSDLLEDNIKKAIKSRTDKQRYPFAIFDKLNNRFVGSTSFGNISTKDKRLEIGWTWIDKNSQGTRLNKYCKHLMLSYAFENLRMERIEFKTDNRNIQSKKAIEKIGGTFEGILRSHTLMLDGHRRDTAYYSILKNEWDNINGTIFKEIKTLHNTV
jgi:RimJ/RimL family protein N-acetyltransferase